MATISPVCLQNIEQTVDFRGLTRLVEAIGADDFAAALLNYCQAELDADFVSVFSFAGTAMPELVATATNTHPVNVSKAASGYRRCFTQDINYQIAASDKGAQTYLTYQHHQHIQDRQYRYACYERTGIEDRFSLVRTGQHQQMALSVYKAQGKGSFEPAAGQQLLRCGGLLIAIIDQHFYRQKRLNAQQASDFEHHLRFQFPALTPRECEVTARVITGETAQQIATALQLSVTTVITHRKNAYQRLGVANLRQLMQLLL